MGGILFSFAILFLIVCLLALFMLPNSLLVPLMLVGVVLFCLIIIVRWVVFYKPPVVVGVVSPPLGPKIHFLLSILVLLLNIPIQYAIGLISLGLSWSPSSNRELAFGLGFFVTMLSLFLVTFMAYRLFQSGEIYRDQSSAAQTFLRLLNIIIGIGVVIFYLIWHSLFLLRINI